MGQTNCPLQEHQRAEGSAMSGFLRIFFFNLPPLCRHCVAYRITHHSKLCKMYWICQNVRSEDVHDDHVLQKTRDRFLRLELIVSFASAVLSILRLRAVVSLARVECIVQGSCARSCESWLFLGHYEKFIRFRKNKIVCYKNREREARRVENWLALLKLTIVDFDLRMRKVLTHCIIFRTFNVKAPEQLSHSNALLLRYKVFVVTLRYANLARTIWRIFCIRAGLETTWFLLTSRTRLHLKTGIKDAQSWTAASMRLEPNIS